MAHSIGKTIAELRKEKGWTQIELAEKLQVSDKAVSKWEQEGGIPSVEFFPALAEIFGVSIDYLMTGKKVKPEIIAISKAELCAKNDDVSLVKDINLTTTDENGKTLIDYVIQYESLAVFAEICKINQNNISKFKIVDAVKYCILSNRLNLLTKVAFQLVSNVRYEFDTAKDILGLLPEEALEHFGNKQGVDKYACILPESFFELILSDERINKETIDFLLGKQLNRECIWYHAFPYLIHKCYENNNNEMLSRLLTLSKKNNDYAYKNLTNKQNYAFNYFFIGFYNSKQGHGLVRILEKTIKLALERSDIETVEKLNSLNTAVMEYYDQFKCYIATADEIRIAKLKMDKSISESEIKIQSTIHEGVVCVKELVELKDFKTIKKVILENPIHELEVINSLIENSDLRTLFRYSVDKKLSWHIDKIVTGNTAKLGDGFVDVLWKDFGPNQHEFYYRENGRKKEIFSRVQRGYSGYTQPKTLKEALELINRCRQRIIDDLSLKYDKEKTVGELTKEYFENELAKGNTDMVIIKLCVRLEAILSCDYHYEGDLSVMIDKYCQEHGWEDDGWGYSVESECVKYLQKLRMKRNNIVHSEKNNIDLTLEELKYCIDYICKMG